MQIYTRTGDQGITRIIGGHSIYKDDERIHAFGEIDELNSFIGVCRSHYKLWDSLEKELIQIQHYLFDSGTDLANPDTHAQWKLTDDTLLWLESCIDRYSTIPNPIEYFILPGGSPLASYLHVLRTVTRRVERQCVQFTRNHQTNPLVIKFINRLSDYFFVCARVANYYDNQEDITYQGAGKVFHNELTKKDIPK